MKIFNNSNVQSVMKAYGKSAPKAENKTSMSIPSDKVEISSEGREYQLAMDSLKNVSDVREEEVSELKSQVEDGSYGPSAEDILEKLFQ